MGEVYSRRRERKQSPTNMESQGVAFDSDMDQGEGIKGGSGGDNAAADEPEVTASDDGDSDIAGGDCGRSDEHDSNVIGQGMSPAEPVDGSHGGAGYDTDPTGSTNAMATCNHSEDSHHSASNGDGDDDDDDDDDDPDLRAAIAASLVESATATQSHPPRQEQAREVIELLDSSSTSTESDSEDEHEARRMRGVKLEPR